MLRDAHSYFPFRPWGDMIGVGILRVIFVGSIMLARRPLVWFAVMFAAGILWARYGAIPVRFAWVLIALSGLSLVDAVMRARLRDARRQALAASRSAAENPPTSATPPANTFSPKDSPLVSRVNWVSWLGRQRLLLAVGLLLAGLGCLRQLQVNGRDVQARADLPGYFIGALEILEPPEQAITRDDAGFWQCSARLLRVLKKKRQDTDAARPAATVRETKVNIAVKLRGWGERSFQRGDVLHGRLRRRFVPVKAFPGAYDARHRLETRGLAMVLEFVRDRKKETPAEAKWLYTITPATSVIPLRLFDRLRKAAVRNILAVLPDQRGAFLAAAMFGYRGKLDHDLRDDFRNAGIGHVLAISGLHVGLIVGLAWWTFSWFISDRRWLGMVCLGVCLSYLALSGGRVAAIRASVLAVIYLGGYVLNRRGDFTNSLGAAALLLSAVNPAVLTDLGFQLSFSAVLFISRLCGAFESAVKTSEPPLTAGRWFNQWRDYLRRLLLSVRGLATLSVAAWLGVWPLTAYAFQQVNPAGLGLNIIVLPLMSLVLAGGVLLQVVSALPGGIGSWGAWLCAGPTAALSALAESADALPWASIKVPPPSPTLLLIYYALFAIFFLRETCSVERLRRILIGVTFVAIALVTIGMVEQMRIKNTPKQTRLTLLPGYTGDTIIVESATGEVAVVGVLERAGIDVARYLHYRRRDQVDLALHFTKSGKPKPPRALIEHLQPKHILTVAQDRLALKRLAPETCSIVAALFAESHDWMSLAEFPLGKFYFSWSQTSRVSRHKKASPKRKHLSRAPLVWWAVQCDGLSIGQSEASWASQVAYRFRRDAPGTNADCLVIRIKDRKKSARVIEQISAPWAFLRQYLTAKQRARGLRERRPWGAIVLTRNATGETILQGFDGERWVDLAPASGLPSDAESDTVW